MKKEVHRQLLTITADITGPAVATPGDVELRDYQAMTPGASAMVHQLLFETPDAAKIADILQARISAVRPPAALGAAGSATRQSAASADIPTQIRQLAELRDSGIVTEDEFQRKKTELLSRM